MAANPVSPGSIASYRYLAGTNFEDAITAAAGGGQTNGYKITAQMSVVDTVATPGDSITLPKLNGSSARSASPGGALVVMFIQNNGSNPCQVFGTTPDTINDVATGTGLPIDPNGGMICWGQSFNQTTNVGEWHGLFVPGYAGAAITPPLRYSSIPIGGVAYSSLGTNTTDINGQVWVTSVFVPTNKTITKLGVLQGGTATTDSVVMGIYNSLGQLIGNTAVAGTALSGANTFLEAALTNPAGGSLLLTGESIYFLSVQGNGTAAGAIRTVATATYIDIYSNVVAGTFGTLPNLTPPTTFTAGQAPIMTVF